MSKFLTILKKVIRIAGPLLAEIKPARPNVPVQPSTPVPEAPLAPSPTPPSKPAPRRRKTPVKQNPKEV
jgi:hypothetical protein